MFYPQQNMNFYNPEINNMYLNSNPFYNNSFPVSETNKKFISNVYGDFISDQQAASIDYWAQHMRMPVRFSQGVEKLISKLWMIFYHGYF